MAKPLSKMDNYYTVFNVHYLLIIVASFEVIYNV